jgi:hypothetical protein
METFDSAAELGVGGTGVIAHRCRWPWRHGGKRESKVGAADG